MSFETDLIAYLAADAGIAALVGTRVYADGLPQLAKRPALVLATISAVRGQYLDGPSGAVDARMQIDCEANDRPTAKAVFAAVNAALTTLARAAPTTMGSTAVGSLTIEDERDANYLPDDGSNTRVYVTSADAMFLYRE